MIQWVKIENFRSLRNVEFRLAPLTVFLGPNGSGKSSILQALDFSRPYQLSDRWRHRPVAPSMYYRLPGDHQLIRRDRSASTGLVFQTLRLNLDRMRAPNQLAISPQLAGDGSNLTNVFDALSRKEREALSEQFCALVPAFGDVDRIAAVNTVGGFQELRFQDRWDSEVWYRPDEVSDGSLLILTFLLLQYQKPQPFVVAIEEPERGLHPYLIEQLMRLLQKISRGEVGGKAVQILLATHSPQLVDFADPAEVRFVDRDPKTGDVRVTAPPTGASEWPAVLEEYKQSMSAVWLSGSLGGVPGA